MSKYREILKSWETPFNQSQEDAWQKLEMKISLQPAQQHNIIQFNWKPLVSVAAAAVVIIALVIFWPTSQLIRVETAMKETKTVVLPDQSEVNMNAGTVMSYNGDWSKERTVQLDGQAFFNVEKGSKFTVVTSQGLVEVMGTSFDVLSRKDKFRVECRTGKVRVSLKSSKSEVMVVPGGVAELNGKNLIISNFDLALGDWQIGEFMYKDEPLQNVLDELSRQFGIVLHANISSDRLYTGRFNNVDLNKALELVCLPMSLKFEVRGDHQVFITELSR